MDKDYVPDWTEEETPIKDWTKCGCGNLRLTHKSVCVDCYNDERRDNERD